jgi:hypothetical protein
MTHITETEVRRGMVLNGCQRVVLKMLSSHFLALLLRNDSNSLNTAPNTPLSSVHVTTHPKSGRCLTRTQSKLRLRMILVGREFVVLNSFFLFLRNTSPHGIARA